jgi:hypothetical protein
VTWQLVRVQAVAGLADGGSRWQWRRSRIRPRQRAQVWRRVGGGGALREKEGVGERYNEVRVPMQIKSCN